MEIKLKDGHFWAWTWDSDPEKAIIRIVTMVKSNGRCLATVDICEYISDLDFYESNWLHYSETDPRTPKYLDPYVNENGKFVFEGKEYFVPKGEVREKVSIGKRYCTSTKNGSIENWCNIVDCDTCVAKYETPQHPAYLRYQESHPKKWDADKIRQFCVDHPGVRVKLPGAEKGYYYPVLIDVIDGVLVPMIYGSIFKWTDLESYTLDYKTIGKFEG